MPHFGVCVSVDVFLLPLCNVAVERAPQAKKKEPQPKRPRCKVVAGAATASEPTAMPSTKGAVTLPKLVSEVCFQQLIAPCMCAVTLVRSPRCLQRSRLVSSRFASSRPASFPRGLFPHGLLSRGLPLFLEGCFLEACFLEACFLSSRDASSRPASSRLASFPRGMPPRGLPPRGLLPSMHVVACVQGQRFLTQLERLWVSRRVYI